MKCHTCQSTRLAGVVAKCSDLFNIHFFESGTGHHGYVPNHLGIGRGDYIRFTYCLNCGQIQHPFPITDSPLLD